MDELCICSYCWRLVRWEDHQIRLIIRCLPEYTAELSKRLQGRSIKCRVRAHGTVIIANADSVVRMATALGVSPLLATALHRYKEAWEGARKGKKLAPDTREIQRRAVRGVMALVPRVSKI